MTSAKSRNNSEVGISSVRGARNRPYSIRAPNCIVDIVYSMMNIVRIINRIIAGFILNIKEIK